MSDSTVALRHKIASARDLQSVVRTMRALAASSIHQYEQSVLALGAYRSTVELGLGACLRETLPAAGSSDNDVRSGAGAVGVIVFGSDQGLVGQFNEVVAEHLIASLQEVSGHRKVWVVGERIQSRLDDAGITIAERYPLPDSVEGIAPLVDRLLLSAEKHASQSSSPRILTFHNRPLAGALYEPVEQHLLPLDAAWRARLMNEKWPARNLPQVLGKNVETLRALIREHLFISLFQACAESLASENASRLAAMQRADQNIAELLSSLMGRFHRQRQGAIDEELFEVTSAYAALASDRGNPRAQ